MATGIRILRIEKDGTFESYAIPSANISYIKSKYRPIDINDNINKNNADNKDSAISQEQKFSRDDKGVSLQIHLIKGDSITFNLHNSDDKYVFFILEGEDTILEETASVEEFSLYFMQFCIGKGD